MEFKEQYGYFRHEASGKVREIYKNDLNGTILLVATDRVSAFDKVLDVTIPGKGQILTAISAEMMRLADEEWGAQTAFVWASTLLGNRNGACVESYLDQQLADRDGFVPAELVGRATELADLEMLNVECIVRGHISGSAWKLYEAGAREICGVPLPEGLKNGSKLPKPIFTPTTKAPVGQHDENIDFGEMTEIIGDKEIADEVYCMCMDLYEQAYAHLLSCGLILADTKFEVGIDGLGNVLFGDELLTPDSSRYWDVETFVPGEEPLSFDKQIVRNYLAGCKMRGEEVTALPDEIIVQTRRRYIQLFEKATGYFWPE